MPDVDKTIYTIDFVKEIECYDDVKARKLFNELEEKLNQFGFKVSRLRRMVPGNAPITIIRNEAGK